MICKILTGSTVKSPSKAKSAPSSTVMHSPLPSKAITSGGVTGPPKFRTSRVTASASGQWYSGSCMVGAFVGGDVLGDELGESLGLLLGADVGATTVTVTSLPVYTTVSQGPSPIL